MNREDKEAKIQILKDGPYVVRGNVPLLEKIIMPKGKAYEYKDGRQIRRCDNYSLCRCGETKDAPFCDGSHILAKFDGSETASKENYEERLSCRIQGPKLDLLDDGRCGLARLCHREKGDAWELAELAETDGDIEELTQAATLCPTGRLTLRRKDGAAIEPDYEAAIEVLQDSELELSGPLAVKGGIPVISADGKTYEIRNRLGLCRCGHSGNKPFCDGRHVEIKFKDR